MSNLTQYCPVCGTMLTVEEICPTCNYLVNHSKSSNKSQSQKESSADIGEDSENKLVLGSENWHKMERIFTLIWPWIWRVTFLLGIGLWIWSFIRIFQFKFWYFNFITFLLNTGAVILLLFYSILYITKVERKEYHFLANDSIVIGQFRFPKVLVITLGITIGLYFWGGLPVFIAVLLILFLGPVKPHWRVDRFKISQQDVNQEEKKELQEKKREISKPTKKKDESQINKNQPKQTKKKSTKQTKKKSTKQTKKKSTKQTKKKSTKQTKKKSTRQTKKKSTKQTKK
ncbi:MAG: hypothetical protein K9W44_09445 [Candidatus Lokiarchaeota archaeon]|nr:hypothetical protein [Candidatus Harpocratesius repetitus]